MTDTLHAELVTPEKIIFSEAVTQVDIPGAEGDFGVLPGHMNLISIIRPGVVSFHKDGGIRRVFVSGGVAEVTGESCTILAEQEIALDALTRAEAEAKFAAAQKAYDSAGTEEQKSAAQKEVALAEALLAALS